MAAAGSPLWAHDPVGRARRRHDRTPTCSSSTAAWARRAARTARACCRGPATSPSTPVEVAERNSPLFFHYKRCAPARGGRRPVPRRPRPGHPVRGRVRHARSCVIFMAERTPFAAPGLAGGGAGGRGDVRINGRRSTTARQYVLEQGDRVLVQHAGRRRLRRKPPPAPQAGRRRPRAGLRGRDARSGALGAPNAERIPRESTSASASSGARTSGCCRAAAPTSPTCGARTRCTSPWCAARTPTRGSCAIDVAAARACPGVVDVVTFDDMPELARAIPMRLAERGQMRRYLQRPLAHDKVRYVGEPVAAILADDRYRAEDALAVMQVRVRAPPRARGRARGRRSPGAPLLFESEGTNAVATYTVACGDVDQALRAADLVLRECFYVQRHAGVPLETRGALADWDAGRGVLSMWGMTKVPHINRRIIAEHAGLPEHARALSADRRRRRLRHPRRGVPRRLPRRAAGPAHAAPRAVDRGPSRAPAGRQPLARAAPRDRRSACAATGPSSPSTTASGTTWAPTSARTAPPRPTTPRRTSPAPTACPTTAPRSPAW